MPIFITSNPSNALATISVTGVVSLASIHGKVELVASSAFIGLVSTASINGTVSISNTVPVTLTSTAISSIVPGTDNTNLGAAVDAARGATKVGVLAIGLRNDTLSTLTPVDNDYVEGLRVDSVGALWGHIRAIEAGANFIGLATVVQANQPALVASSAFIGLATVIVGNSPSFGSNITLNPSSAFIGLVSTASIHGKVELVASSAFIGLATIVNANQPALIAGSAYIGLASVNIGGTLPALTAGSSFVGLATVVVGNTPNANVSLGASSQFIGLVSTASINGTVAISNATLTVDTELPTPVSLVDGVSVTPTTVMVGAIPVLFNGIGTGDRQRSVTGAFDASSQGIAASGMTGQFDDSSPKTLTEGNFGVARFSTRREVYVQLRDAAGNERGLNIDAQGNLGAMVSMTTVSVSLLGSTNVVSNLISLATAGRAQIVPASPLTGRKSLSLYNSSATIIWLGSISLASGRGIPLLSQEKFSIDSQTGLYALPVFNGQNLNCLEFS